MNSPYDLVRITAQDLKDFVKNPEKGKVGAVLKLVLDELPYKLRIYTRFITPTLKPIRGFEDRFVKGYEIKIKENREIEMFVRRYIPFFLLRKESLDDI